MFGDRGNQLNIRCYVVRHRHCLGHREDREWTACQWMAEQHMEDYNEINARWAQIATHLRRSPFAGKGMESPATNMAHMAAYNIDTFRRFVFESSFLSRIRVPQERLEAVRKSDTALLVLGFDWILRFLTGQGPLRE